MQTTKRLLPFLQSITLAIFISSIPLSSWASHTDIVSPEDIVRHYYNHKIKPFTTDAAVILSLKKQSAEHKNLSHHDLIRLNDRWVSELKSNQATMQQKLLQNDISKKLVTMRENASGLVINAVLVDKYSVAVGQTSSSKLYWYTEDLILHSLLRRKKQPSHYISDILYNETSHYFYIRAYFVVPYNENVAILIVDFDAEEVDYLSHKQANASPLGKHPHTHKESIHIHE